MCHNKACPLAWLDQKKLKALCNEIEDQLPGSLMSRRVEPGYLIYDVCVKLGFDPREVLPAEVVNRIETWQNSRLWPTLSEAEEAEMVDLAGIREPNISDNVSPISDHDGLEAGWSLERLAKYLCI